jgi:uracil-DNA glycosylase family 4
MTLQQLNAELLDCRRCPRLVEWREKVAIEKKRAYRDQVYWGRPVPGFGDPHAHVFVVGMAPGAHGSNRTGRQFTGDSSGDFLYPALYRAGFASQPVSVSRDDGLTLFDLYTAPVCRCAPPDNKPTSQEIINCQSYLEREFKIIKPIVIVVLGRIAFTAIMDIYRATSFGEEGTCITFSHAAVYHLRTSASCQLPSDFWLVCSYHPSRQNTQTGRLTEAMFDQVWVIVRELLGR